MSNFIKATFSDDDNYHLSAYQSIYLRPFQKTGIEGMVHTSGVYWAEPTFNYFVLLIVNLVCGY